jgi:hypothetical protein
MFRKFNSYLIASVLLVMSVSGVGVALYANNKTKPTPELGPQPTLEPSARKPVRFDVKPDFNTNHLKDYTVTVVAYRNKEDTSPDGWGTGFIFHGRHGETFVWTAAHVISGTRKDRCNFVGAVEIMWIKRNDLGEPIGREIYQCDVLKYSHQPNSEDQSLGDDLAILEVKTKKLGKSVKFCCDKAPPKNGAVIWHAGTMNGRFGGLITSQGRVGQAYLSYQTKGYYQVSIMAMKGSSGGPIFYPNGEVIAMLTRGRSDMFNAAVPHWRMREWADRVHASWAYNTEYGKPADSNPTEESYSRRLNDLPAGPPTRSDSYSDYYSRSDNNK